MASPRGLQTLGELTDKLKVGAWVARRAVFCWWVGDGAWFPWRLNWEDAGVTILKAWNFGPTVLSAPQTLGELTEQLKVGLQ